MNLFPKTCPPPKLPISRKPIIFTLSFIYVRLPDGLSQWDLPLEFFLESSLSTVSSSTWQMENNVQQLHADNVPQPPPVVLTNGIGDAANDLNYLSSLVENVININNNVGMSNMAGQDQGDPITLDCLPRQELNDWVATQQCPNYIFWDGDIDEATVRGDHYIIAPDTSNAGSNSLPSFPSPL